MSQQYSIRHKVECNISVREEVNEVTDKRPVRMLLQHGICAVDYFLVALWTICTLRQRTTFRSSPIQHILSVMSMSQ